MQYSNVIILHTTQEFVREEECHWQFMKTKSNKQQPSTKLFFFVLFLVCPSSFSPLVFNGVQFSTTIKLSLITMEDHKVKLMHWNLSSFTIIWSRLRNCHALKRDRVLKWVDCSLLRVILIELQPEEWYRCFHRLCI